MTPAMWILGAAAGAMALGLVVWAVIRRRRRSVESVLRRLSWDQFVDLTLPDDVDGEIHLDRIMLTGAGIIVLDIRALEGTAFAADHLDNWTALHAGGRTVIKNPLPGLRARLHAVRALAPGAPVDGYVLLLGKVRFSGAPPRRVVTLEQLQALLPPRDGEAPEDLTASWEGIREAAREMASRAS